MLRTIFVIAVILIGLFFSVQSPFYALLFYFWLAYFRPETWIWTDFLSQFNLSLILGCFILVASLPSVGRFRITGRIVLILLFLGQSVVSLFASEHFELSLPYWIEFLKVVVIVLVMTFLITDTKRYRLALLVIAFSLGFETAKQGWAQLVLNPGGSNTNTHPVLGDNNGVAVGVLMLVPIFVALAQTARTKWAKFVYRFFSAGLIYRAISTYSRGGFIAGGVLAAIMLWRSPRKLRAIVLGAAVVAVILSVMPAEYWDRMNSITASEETRDDSAQGRLHFWHVAVLMAQAKPFTGVGFNGFRPSYATYDDEEGWGEGRATHSAWFATMADMGYPGLVLLMAILASALAACSRIKKIAIARGQQQIGVFATNLQASLLVYIAGATFLSIQYNEMLWHLIGLTIVLQRIQAESLSEPDVERVVPAVVDGLSMGLAR